MFCRLNSLIEFRQGLMHGKDAAIMKGFVAIYVWSHIRITLELPWTPHTRWVYCSGNVREMCHWFKDGGRQKRDDIKDVLQLLYCISTWLDIFVSSCRGDVVLFSILEESCSFLAYNKMMSKKEIFIFIIFQLF